MITLEKDGVKFTFENVEDLEKCLKLMDKIKIEINVRHSYPYSYPQWTYTIDHQYRPWVTYTTCGTVSNQVEEVPS